MFFSQINEHYECYSFLSSPLVLLLSVTRLFAWWLCNCCCSNSTVAYAARPRIWDVWLFIQQLSSRCIVDCYRAIWMETKLLLLLFHCVRCLRIFSSSTMLLQLDHFSRYKKPTDRLWAKRTCCGHAVSHIIHHPLLVHFTFNWFDLISLFHLVWIPTISSILQKKMNLRFYKKVL